MHSIPLRFKAPFDCAYALALMIALLIAAPASAFDYRDLIAGTATLTVRVGGQDSATGDVTITGGDTARPTVPFTFDWGDGGSSSGFFPQVHRYSATNRNYVVKVTATHADGTFPVAAVVVKFVPVVATLHGLDPAFRVSILPVDTVLPLQGGGSRSLAAIDGSAFRNVARPTVEDTLSLAAGIQSDFVNGGEVRFGSAFEQRIGRNPTLPNQGGSLWNTIPPAVELGDAFLTADVPWTPLFHELGHNMTLNFPAGFTFGGRIDGQANAIYSEALARIFQQATAYELVNRAAEFGIGEDLAQDIAADARAWFVDVRNAHLNYIAQGKPFASWNHPGTPVDETFGTFATIAYKFIEHAENGGQGMRWPVKRLAKHLALFNADYAAQWDRLHDTPQAAVFRSTFMISALSDALLADLRAEFRALNFPVDDALFDALQAAAGENRQGLWWNAPAGSESGWGINLNHQGDTIFATWFTFGPDGKPLWLVMSANSTPVDPNVFKGDLYTGTGPRFDAFDPALVAPAKVGSATLTFTGPNAATFAYTVNGIARSKQITRQQFGTTMPRCGTGTQANLVPSANFQDIWWRAPANSEPGWGVNITHQGDTLFASWFTFGRDGKPLWLVAAANRTAPYAYSGTLYTGTGPAYNAVPFDPSKVVPASVGTASFAFADGNNGTFAYTVDGVAQTKSITRQVFAAAGTVCQ